MRFLRIALPVVMGMAMARPGDAAAQAAPAAPALQDYEKPGQLAPLPQGQASLYRVPWRSNPRTASALEALEGLGVYYKHIAANPHVMGQMAAAGVKRLRLAPHHTMYIHKDWTGPSASELANLEGEFKGCKAAGIRPCVVFVHIPIMGTDDAGQAWVRNTWKKELMAWGPPGSEAYKLYLEKTYLGMLAILNAARAAGFTEEASYDLEMGQNLWWGFPALPPFPGLTLESLQPGGLLYEFDKALVERARAEGYREPVLYNSQCHHHFDRMDDRELIPGQAGRAISIYSSWGGTVGKGWLGETVEVTNPDGSRKRVTVSPTDEWPAREPLVFAEGRVPEMVLARPESYLADFSRHDNLIARLKAGAVPVAITSLGVVPSDIPGATVETADAQGRKTRAMAPGLDGWELKSRGLTRICAFWLNQGARFVLLHSAYEGANDELSHALIPDFGKQPEAFRWEQSRPLKALHAFAEPLRGARKLATLTGLKFRYALAKDTELIPRSEKGGPLMASDAVAILPFQITETSFAVACYVVTPNLAAKFEPTTMTLRVARKLKGDAATSHPSDQTTGQAVVTERQADATTLTLPVTDDVTWLVFEVE
ncbi:MAG: hypothetical protein BWZ02_02134 [Lentisphaerae bacterium ADurb.BinA184]|nr:MAG: hypothetical protein BWZ02_02134 [Lentisphaerae bacterium ADurb.BinA184]